MSDVPPEIAIRAGRIVDNLAALPELAMRSASLVATVSALSAADAVWLVEHIIRGVLARDAKCIMVYSGIAFPEALPGGVLGAHLDAMLKAGREQGAIAAVQWLLSPSVESADSLVESDRLIDASLRDMPLGSRRALARRAKGETINRLASDPDALVVTNLLNNAHVTETVAIKIASRRPTVTSALKAVMRSSRFGKRYRVRLALIKNPYLALKYAVNLLPFLNGNDLKDVRDDEALNTPLRMAAQRLIDLGSSYSSR